ncbi:dual specificity protein phosphatase 15 [Pelomyxa schiedti]|nr:dual specificity protein phosphatase 15 [Pelomyxa schiedti]
MQYTKEEDLDAITTSLVMPPDFDDNFTYSDDLQCYVPNRRDRPDKILEGLYLGDQLNAYNREVLEEIGITHVLSVAEIANLDDHLSMFDPTVQVAAIQLPDEASADICVYFDQAIAFIHECIEQGGKVLVHCVWGMSRSATIVAAYVMQALAMEWLVALRCVQLERPVVFPNVGFAKQLATFGNLLRERRAHERAMRIAYLETSKRDLHKFMDEGHFGATEEDDSNANNLVSVDCSGR